MSYGFVMMRSAAEAFHVCEAYNGIALHSPTDGIKRIKVLQLFRFNPQPAQLICFSHCFFQGVSCSAK